MTSNENKDTILTMLSGSLIGGYEEELLSMKVETARISHFDPKMCPEERVETKYKGTYKWPQTVPADVTQQTCVRNMEHLASRSCLINIETEKSYWRRQNVTSCQLLQGLPNSIVSLQNVTITMDNAEDLADHILILLNSSKWSEEEIKVLVDKLMDIANFEEISPTLARKTLQIIDIFMTREANMQLHKNLSSILQLTQRIGFKMSFNGRNASIVMPKLALAMMRPDPVHFQGIAFGVISYNPEMDPELAIQHTPFTTSLASIFLPGILRDYLSAQSFDPNNHTGIQFSFFGIPSLFQDRSFGEIVLNTYVIGSSIESVCVQNLKEPVNIILRHIEPKMNDALVHCVFWDFNKNDGLGGWNTSGCEAVYSDANYTICNCTHLTHFGVLMDIYRDPINEADNWNLTLVSYVGCGISSIFLGLALVVYLSIEKLRRDYLSKILINLCLALLMLNLMFLVNPWLASFQKRILCITVAVVLHYFLLASFTWMGLEAIHMYYALVKVFNTYVPHYILKFSIAGWGIPTIIVATVLAIRRDFYGTGPVSRSTDPLESFCWIQDDMAFYISVVAYFCLVFLINVSMFIIVLLQVHAMKAKHHFPEDHCGQDFLHSLKRVASLTFLLGLTWGFAFFAKGPVQVFFLYLFALCNTLQGFFIFLFHCLMKENVRKQCQVHFCCGRFRLKNSYWSSSATTLAYPPVRNLERKPSSLSLKSLKSCATNSTSNGSGSLTSADAGAKTEQIWCSAGSASLTHQESQLPHVRKLSRMEAELRYAEKTMVFH
ncbi:adhesion G-protein coupled receptor G4-like [Sceloporus undulatus]|uniref:adhesion G-protein coupled receptor G4-like n=1 Tax=Sceloporus undulatus TaxID=8520 RepID=UPI001C4C1AEE|nr:adhesion G-protein coupled receptor G4-like [Sceloporus undulatus]